MISLNFNISNPWSDRWKILWSKNGLITKHKAWEFNGYQTHHIIEIDFEVALKGHHACFPRITLGLFGYTVELQIYDCRHWDYKENTWST